MNCPVCDRLLAPTLSICPACGAMMNDTVREDLASKITSGELPRLPQGRAAEMIVRERPVMAAAPEPVRKAVTADLRTPKTSPTLVEFQNKNASLPDWRLQLQNAVQARRGSSATSESERTFPTNGGAALKAEVVQPPPPAAATPNISDPRVANAIRRIDSSRQRFAEPAIKRPEPPKAAPRAFPFDVVSGGERKPVVAARPLTAARAQAALGTTSKPKLVVPPPANALKRDTNKLPRIPVSETIERVTPIPEPVEERPVVNVVSAQRPAEFADIKRIRIKAENVDLPGVEEDIYDDEIEDLAPVSMRFCAGLFDLIVGVFVSMICIAPFALNGGDWFTASGGLITAGVWAFVMFAYLTVSLGLTGKTIGMRVFSLELVDAIENEYPTLQQAAINSSLFLLSLAFGGAGFLTLLFNEERRAVHDLLSGTILVREF